MALPSRTFYASSRLISAVSANACASVAPVSNAIALAFATRDAECP